MTPLPSSRGRSFVRLLAGAALFLVPAGIALAELPIPQGIESLPAEAVYGPPCARGDLFIQNVCVPRREAETLRSEATLRTQERRTTRNETKRTQAKEVRSTPLHATGVRAAQSNGFELLSPNSRQFKCPESELQMNLRQLRVHQKKMGPAISRVDTTPQALWTTRTREVNAKTPLTPELRRQSWR